ncbi:MAG: helix-turn-helix transcriptional regulator [Clostridia bacterium]|nr:helix-turn-helix transcriptional regulator [Clostridia bacterium]
MESLKCGIENIAIRIKGTEIRLDFADCLKTYCYDNGANLSDRIKEIHYHNYCEIFLVSDNTMKLSTPEAVFEISDSVVVVPAGVKHFYMGAKTEGEVFSFRLLNSAMGIDGNIKWLEMDSKMKCYIQEILNIYKSGGAFFSDKLSALFTLIVTEIIEKLRIIGFAEGECGKTGEYIDIIEDIINRRYTERLTLTMVAEALHLSEKQTSRIIKREYGKTLSQVLNDKKLSVAVMLLRYTDNKIDEILSQLNFESKNYFFTLFKKTFHMTPGEYRKNTK